MPMLLTSQSCGSGLSRCRSSIYRDRPQHDMNNALGRLVGDPTTTPSRKYFSVGYYVEHPSSLGFVHIRDGQNPAVLPEFETGFLKT